MESVADAMQTALKLIPNHEIFLVHDEFDRVYDIVLFTARRPYRRQHRYTRKKKQNPLNMCETRLLLLLLQNTSIIIRNFSLVDFIPLHRTALAEPVCALVLIERNE